MADLTPVTLAELSKLHEAATPPPWRAGRPDTVSYEGNSNVAYKNVYGPNYEPKLHLGRPVAVDIARGIGELCIANAELIAAMRNALPALLAAARRGVELESAIAFLSEHWQLGEHDGADRTSQGLLMLATELGWPGRAK